MQYVISFTIGIIVGVAAYFLSQGTRSLTLRRKAIGDLGIVRSDMDRPYLYLSFNAGTNVNLDEIINSKYVVFRVDVKDFIPHE